MLPQDPTSQAYVKDGSAAGSMSVPVDGADTVQVSTVNNPFLKLQNTDAYLAAMMLGTANAPPTAQPPTIASMSGNSTPGVRTLWRVPSLTGVAPSLAALTGMNPGDIVEVANTSTMRTYGKWVYIGTDSTLHGKSDGASIVGSTAVANGVFIASDFGQYLLTTVLGSTNTPLPPSFADIEGSAGIRCVWNVASIADLKALTTMNEGDVCQVFDPSTTSYTAKGIYVYNGPNVTLAGRANDLTIVLSDVGGNAVWVICDIQQRASTSAGAGDAWKLAQLGSGGKLSFSMLDVVTTGPSASKLVETNGSGVVDSTLLPAQLRVVDYGIIAGGSPPTITASSGTFTISVLSATELGVTFNSAKSSANYNIIIMAQTGGSSSISFSVKDQDANGFSVVGQVSGAGNWGPAYPVNVQISVTDSY